MPVSQESHDHIVKGYTFDRPLPPPTAEDELPEDLFKLTHAQLVQKCTDYHTKCRHYERELTEELKEKQTQASWITSLEMHLNVPLPKPKDSAFSSYAAHVGLDHANMWTEMYGPDQELLVEVNRIQRGIITRRLEEMYRTARECNAVPACKHVLSARPGALGSGEEAMKWKQVIRGMPVRKYMALVKEEEEIRKIVQEVEERDKKESKGKGKGKEKETGQPSENLAVAQNLGGASTEPSEEMDDLKTPTQSDFPPRATTAQDDPDFHKWNGLSSDLIQALGAFDEITDKEWEDMDFLTAYFRAMTTKHFENKWRTSIKEDQEKAHQRKNTAGKCTWK